MMEYKVGLKIIALVFGIHLLLGVLAVLSGGFFIFGATAPERIFMHLLSGAETHVSFNGAHKVFFYDLCLQKCPTCNVECYSPEVLNVSCDDGPCILQTKKGVFLAKEGDEFSAILKLGLIYSNATFKCYEECGFDTKIHNLTYSSKMPE
ncbi:MAG: hypothetical protein KKD39_00150 [Candidatus Altiarchaeota archaeon]|nr:hypothetical protein [Candidatus Altiarchaeota archaeon]